MICKGLYADFGIESTLVVFLIPSEKSGLLSNFFDEAVRGIDTVCKVSTDGKTIILTLLPLSSLSVAKGFTERIKRQIIETFGTEFLEGIEHISFNLNKNVEANIGRILDVRR